MVHIDLEAVWTSPAGYHLCEMCKETFKDISVGPFGRLYTRNDLAGIKPPDTTFGPYIVTGGVNMLYGKWGSAKSFLALSWAAALTTGIPWNGYTTEPTNVIYWAAEGLNGLHSRLSAWETYHETVIPDDRFRVPQRSPALDKQTAFYSLAQLVDEAKATHLIIDTLIRIKGGLRENEADELGGYLLTELAHQICNEYGCSVTLVHHVGHEAKDRPRGSSSITDNVDGLYEIRNTGAGIRTLYVRKLKDQSFEDTPDNLRLISVGESAVLEPTVAVPLTDQQNEVLKALEQLSPRGEWIPSTIISAKAGVHRNRVREALGKLVGGFVDYRLGRGQASEYRLVRGARPIQEEVPGFGSVHPPDDMPDPY